MTRRRSSVVVLNYHRVVAAPDAGPPHMLHTVPTAAFREQVDRCRELAPFTTLDAVVDGDLGELAFLVTFDDVPAASVGAIRGLAADDVPFGLSVCAGLAEAGRGWRDKVYAICRHAPPEQVLAAVGTALGEPPPQPEGFSFYDFTKSAPLRHDRIMRELVDPLYEALPEHVRVTLAHREYAGWETVSELARDPLATLSNHSWNHASFERLTPEERRRDVGRAHAAIEAATGKPPRHLTVPFGYVTQSLLVDLTALADEFGYRSVLWTHNRANLVVEPYLGRRMTHLLRIDAAPTTSGFAEQLSQALAAPLSGPTALFRRSLHGDPVTVTSTSDPRRAAQLETLLRPDKDYAAAPAFYDYAFTSNPYRGERADYALAESDAGPEAIAYAHHSRFAIGAAREDGIYVASWRRMPRAGRMTGSAVFRRLTAGEPVVGVYKPSDESAPALRGWTATDVFEHAIELGDNERPAAGLEVVTLDAYDPALDPVAAAATAGRFTVARDATFYRWRIDRYPLARARYVALRDGSATVAFAALLTIRDAAALADFAALDPAWLPALFDATFAVATVAGARTVTVETSSSAASAVLVERHGGRRTRFQNHYRLTGDLLRSLPPGACPDGAWDERFVHETQVTGDVLLR